MAPPKLNKTCSIEGCDRKHAAHGLCLMHYRRQGRHGSPDYRWGGKVVGRACLHCDRPVAAREMCFRHYQMWRKHGDPLYSDARKKDAQPPGRHVRKGYMMIGPTMDMAKAFPADATVEKSHRHAAGLAEAMGLRDGSQRSRRTAEHRRVAKAKRGEIVHHINGKKTDNDIGNLHVFSSSAAHARAHRSLERIAYDLLEVGLVEFDRSTGLYRRPRSEGQSK